LIIENIQIIILFEKDKFYNENNKKILQEFLKFSNKKFKNFIKYFEESDNLERDLKEIQQQLYFKTLKFLLSKINKFLKNKKKNSKNQIKILSIFENLKINSNEISTNWNEFFINYSFELIKMKIFNQQKNKKIEKFLNLINVKILN